METCGKCGVHKYSVVGLERSRTCCNAEYNIYVYIYIERERER